MRHSKAKARLQLELDLLAEAEQLQAAKQAYLEHPTPETREARRAAMESLAETRTWLRAVEGIRKVREDIDRLAARGATASDLQPYEQKIARLRGAHGELIDGMERLAGKGGA